MEVDEILSNYAEAWGELKDLIGSRGWEFYTDRIRYEASLHQARVLSGRLEPADYQRECGIVQGLTLALEMPAKVKSEYDTRLAQVEEPVQHALTV